MVTQGANTALAGCTTSNVHVTRDKNNKLMLGGRHGARFRCQNQVSSNRNPRLTRIRAGLAVIRKAVNTKNRLSFHSMLAIAYHKISNRSAQAQTWKRDPKTICRSHQFVAAAYIRTQALVCAHILQEELPTWAVAHTMWDETGERLIVDSASTQGGVWQVLVVKLSCAWGCRSQATRYVDFVLPPVPIPTTSSAAIWQAMRFHPMLAAAHEFKTRLLNAANLAFDMHSSDYASGNLKLDAHDMAISPSSWLKETFHCRNHQNHLVATMPMVSCIGIEFLNNLYAAATFLRTSCHWLRSTVSCKSFVTANMQRRYGPPPAADVEFAKELKSYLLANHNVEQIAANGSSHYRSGLPTRPVIRRHSKVAYSKRVEQFFHIYNGGYSESSGLVHVVAGHPWWPPCNVCRCTACRWCLLQASGQRQVHVNICSSLFFGVRFSYGWQSIA